MRNSLVPNFKLCYEAICLSWLSKWISLQNKKLLNLEGSDKKLGWHAYLYYDKGKKDNSFKHHYVCLPQLNCWLKYKSYLPKEMPLWIVPRELIDQHSKLGSLGPLQYKELLLIDGQSIELKPLDQIDNSGSWFQYWQLREIFKEDKRKFGF